MKIKYVDNLEKLIEIIKLYKDNDEMIEDYLTEFKTLNYIELPNGTRYTIK